MPSESAVFQHLERFHDDGEEAGRVAHRAFIPTPTEGLGGLRRMDPEMVSFIQIRSPQTEATLDMDAALLETQKSRRRFTATRSTRSISR